MILNTPTSQSLSSTLNASLSRNDALFFFSSEKVDTVLFHACDENFSRFYDLGTLPRSRAMVLKLTKCGVCVSSTYANSLSTPRLAEGDVERLMVENGGFSVYSWRVESKPYCYLLQAFDSARKCITTKLDAAHKMVSETQTTGGSYHTRQRPPYCLAWLIYLILVIILNVLLDMFWRGWLRLVQFGFGHKVDFIAPDDGHAFLVAMEKNDEWST